MTSALDKPPPDDSAAPPLCSHAQFTELIKGMVADSAPRVFAIVQEYGDRVDAWIAAWGIAFDDHAEVMSVEPGMRATVEAPETARLLFRHSSHLDTRVVWLGPAGPPP